MQHNEVSQKQITGQAYILYRDVIFEFEETIKVEDKLTIADH